MLKGKLALKNNLINGWFRGLIPHIAKNGISPSPSLARPALRSYGSEHISATQLLLTARYWPKPKFNAEIVLTNAVTHYCM